MGQHFIRVYQSLDIEELKKHLLIYGDLSANCANCQAIDIKLTATRCPECQTEFKYVAFRNLRSHLAKLPRLQQERPDVIFIDHDDFQHHWGAWKAKNFLK